MGKPNFSFQKRQKELAKKKKNEEKKQRKLEKNSVTRVEDHQGPAETGTDNNSSYDGDRVQPLRREPEAP